MTPRPAKSITVSSALQVLVDIHAIMCDSLASDSDPTEDVTQRLARAGFVEPDEEDVEGMRENEWANLAAHGGQLGAVHLSDYRPVFVLDAYETEVTARRLAERYVWAPT